MPSLNISEGKIRIMQSMEKCSHQQQFELLNLRKGSRENWNINSLIEKIKEKVICMVFNSKN
jgi:hypothetical protein